MRPFVEQNLGVIRALADRCDAMESGQLVDWVGRRWTTRRPSRSISPERNTRVHPARRYEHVFSPRPSGLVLSPEIRDRVAAAVRAAHPYEAGGYLVCERRDDTIYAVEHIPLKNEAEDPRRRFQTTVEQMPEQPRVFYHSHTTPAAPADLTRTDRKIPERYLLVVFAPRGEAHSYRLFTRGLIDWQELTVKVGQGEIEPDAEPLPRLG